MPGRPTDGVSSNGARGSFHENLSGMDNEAIVTMHVDGVLRNRTNKPAAGTEQALGGRKYRHLEKMPGKRPNRQQQGLPHEPLTVGDVWGIRVESAA